MNKIGKIVIVVVLIVAVVAVVNMKRNKGADSEIFVAEELGSDAAAATSEGKEAAKVEPSEGLPRMVDLGADKCIPCKMMAPILEELKSEYEGRLIVEFIDVWKDPAGAPKYGIKIIPTQIFFDASGNELFRHEGFLSKEDILAKWKELGVDIAKTK